MLQLLVRYMWAFGSRGVLAILYGFFLLMSKGLSLYSFVMVTGFFVLVESLLLLIIALSRHAEKTRMISIEGILGSVIAAIIILGSSIGSMLWPGVTSVMVPVYIGAWALMLSSLLALLCGIAMILRKDAGVFPLQWLITLVAILYGVLQSIMIFQVRSSTPWT